MKRTILAVLLCAASAGAQDVRAMFGTAVFADESAQVHRAVGGSVRLHITPRFAVEPEFAYLRLDRDHYDLLFIPNLTFDFRSLDKRVVPYVTGGVGYLRTSDRFGTRRFTSNSWIAEAGGGVKIYVSRSVFVAPEVRFGSELHIRAGVGLGWTFGR